jgi:hypothetical protein
MKLEPRGKKYINIAMFITWKNCHLRLAIFGVENLNLDNYSSNILYD